MDLTPPQLDALIEALRQISASMSDAGGKSDVRHSTRKRPTGG